MKRGSVFKCSEFYMPQTSFLLFYYVSALERVFCYYKQVN